MKTNRSLILWFFLLLGAVLIYQVFQKDKSVQKQPFSEFIKQVKAKNVREVEVQMSSKIATYHYKLHGQDPKGFSKYYAFGRPKDLDIKFLYEYVPVVKYQAAQQTSLWQQLLISWLPILFLVGIFVLFMRQLQAGGGKAMSFGKSNAKLLTDHHNKVTFDDVAGINEAKEELEEVVLFLREPKKFTRLGGKIPKGVLLIGSPGTGKTLLARAVAGEAGVPFFTISGSNFVEMFVGVGASRVRDLFEQGKRNAPCIIFIDEIDAVGRHRGAGLGGGHDEREQTLNQLLVEMDGFESNEGVIMVAATNRPDVLDPALLRPGRFDRQVVVPLPDVRGREAILKVHVEKTPLSKDVKLDIIARGTPGFSGADLANLVNESALTAARENSDQINMEHFETAKDKVLMGRERRSMMLSEEDKRRTAIHEAGHAIVGIMLPHADPVHKVTIIPRGRALGVTMSLPASDRLEYTRDDLEDRIAMTMGGRAADKIVLGTVNSGAQSDISQATEIAKKMVCEWGMSDKLGPLSYGKSDEQVFLGREISKNRDYSEKTAVDIDEEIRSIVQRNYDRAIKIIEENLDVLEMTTDILMKDETIYGSVIADLIDKKKKGTLHSDSESKEDISFSSPELTASIEEKKEDKQDSIFSVEELFDKNKD